MRRWRTFRTTALSVVLLLSLAGAICQWVGFGKVRSFDSDFRIYTSAAERAWRGDDPYQPRNIGVGYLYPPPSLFLWKALPLVSPSAMGPDYTFLAASVLAGLLAVTLLIGKLDGWRAATALILLGSAGMIETFYLGQINAVVLLLLTAFLRAWRRGSYTLASASLGVAICLKATPIIFVVMFMTRQRIRALVALAGCVAGLTVCAELLIPAAGLTTSFLASVRWAGAQPVGGEWNYSLSSIVRVSLRELFGVQLAWNAVHRVKLVILAGLVGASYLAYLWRRQSNIATGALFVTCNICMVTAPNIVWLHHGALLIPAVSLLLQSKRPGVVGAVLVAWLSIQWARCGQFHIDLPAGVLVGFAQVILLIAAAAYTAIAFRMPPQHVLRH